MICGKCNNPGVLNTVLGKDFYYCRACKEEIILDSPQDLCSHGLYWQHNADRCAACGITGEELMRSIRDNTAAYLASKKCPHNATFTFAAISGQSTRVCSQCGEVV